MKKFVALLCVVALAGPVMADWGEDPDDHKMHFPQLPDEAGWDVMATYPIMLADDWECSQTGYVDDIHFWGSWLGGIEGTITAFEIQIFENIPATETLPSMPGARLWVAEVPFGAVQAVPIDPPSMEGWYNPSNGEVLPADHQAYFQYNIANIADPFLQHKDQIYWLAITAWVDGTELWGWKSSLNHWEDDAFWGIQDAPFGIPVWQAELYEPPDFVQSLDLAFVITGHTPIPAVSEWGLVVMALLGLTAGTVMYRKFRTVPA